MTDDLNTRVEKCWDCENYYTKSDESELKESSYCKIYGILYFDNILKEVRMLRIVLSKCDKGNNYCEKAA